MPYKLPSELGNSGDLLKRFGRVSGRRSLWSGYLQDAFRYTAPNRDTFFEKTKGQSRHREIYDSTAILAARRYVGRLQAMMMPAWGEWSVLTPGSDYENTPDADQISEALEDITKMMFRYVNHSNFYHLLPDSLRDMSISTGAIRIDMGDEVNPFRCTVDTLSALHFEEGPNGIIENVWREPKISIGVLEREYPGLEIPSQWQDKKQNKPDWEPKIIEGSLYVEEKDEYWSFVISQDEKQLLWCQLNGKGRGANPWVVFRDDKIPGEILGRGPALHCLNDVLTANKMVEFELRNAALATAGAWTAVNDGVLNPYTAQVKPGSMIPVGSNSNTNPSLRALERSGDFSVSNLLLDRLQNNIKTAFLNSLRRAAGPVKSATEISIDDRDLMMEEHAAFGRLQTELVQRCVERFLYILAELGMIPKFEVDGREVTIKHTSPLSKVQDQNELESIIKYFEVGMATVGPEVMMATTRMEEVPDAIAKRVGLPQSLLRDQAETQSMIQAAAQATDPNAPMQGEVPMEGEVIQ